MSDRYLKEIKKIDEMTQVINWTTGIGRFICPLPEGQCLKEQCPMCHGRSDGGCQEEGKGEIVMKRSVTRKIDELGRVVIPSDFREELGMEPGEKVEIYIDEGRVILKREVKTDPISEINSLKERISKAYDIAWNNDISSPDCPEYEEMHKALKAVMDALRGENKHELS